MRIRHQSLVWFAACVALLASSTLAAAKKKKNTQPAQISDVISIVTDSLADACSKVDSPAACKDLTGVDITLHTEIDKDGHIGVSIFGISFGGHRESDKYNEFSVHLVPPAPGTAMANATKNDISAQLSAALKAYAEATTVAKASRYPLDTKCFYLEVSFTIQYGASGDTSGLSLIPIFPDVSGKIDRKYVQTVRLTFGQCT